jgi:DNA primase large subunit
MRVDALADLGIKISIGTSDMVKYPFIAQAREFIAEKELDFKDIVDVPAVRDHAKARIRASFPNQPPLLPHKIMEVNIASYPTAIILASATEDSLLIARYALHEAKIIKTYLQSEKKPAIVSVVAKSFKWQVQTNPDGTWIHFENFLKNTSKGRLTQVSKWKLKNRALCKGWVQVLPEELSRLLQEEVQERIEESLNNKVTALPKEIQADVDELKEEFLKVKPQLEEKFDIGPCAEEGEYPPCITTLINRAKSGAHLSHTERITMVTYLLHQGASTDAIANLFSKVSDFNAEKTKYQIENLAGKTTGQPYVTYNCSTLRTHGVCLNNTDPICRRIRNPLTYHKIKQGIPAKNPDAKN